MENNNTRVTVSSEPTYDQVVDYGESLENVNNIISFLEEPSPWLRGKEGKLMANNFFAKLDSELAGPGSKYKLPDAEPAGFWAGFWHGVLLPITFIASLFNSRMRIYENNNKGTSYDFGFMLGALGSLGGSGAIL